MDTNKADKRWWHIEERVSSKKSFIIGRKIQVNWYKDKEVRNQFKWFNSVDMFYWHIVLFGKILEFQYFHRL